MTNRWVECSSGDRGLVSVQGDGVCVVGRSVDLLGILYGCVEVSGG